MSIRSIRFVSYKFIDAKGNLRDKIVRSGSELKNTLSDGSSFGFCLTSDSDVMLVPDKESAHYDPIRNMESVFCTIHRPNGSEKNLIGTFRTAAYNVMMKDEQTQGALFGVEPEFFICKWHAPDRAFIPVDLRHIGELEDEKQEKWYSCLPPLDSFQKLREEIAINLEKAGIDVEAMHHEVAPGQCEFSWVCDNLLRTADKMMLFKYIVSATCATHDLKADFRAKPYENLNGSGCHVHQSIPMMTNHEGEPNTKVVEAYAQGLVDHYDELLEVCCIDETSHKRLVPGFEAPTRENNGWGWYDRTKTVRIVGNGDHLEYRLPDPGMNPYVALPMMLEFGYNRVRKI